MKISKIVPSVVYKSRKIWYTVIIGVLCLRIPSSKAQFKPSSRKGDFPNMNVPPAPNLHIKIVTEKNPWEDTDNRPTLPTLGILLLCLINIVCAAYPAVADRFPSLWFVPLLCAAVFYIRANRTPYGWLLLIAAFGLTWLLSGGSLVLAGMAVCLITTLALTTFLHTIVRHPLLLLLPTLAYGLALLLSGDPISSLVALLAFPAAYVMGRKTLENDTRVSVIASASLLFGGMLLLYGALRWRLSGIEMSMQLITETVEAFRTEILEFAVNDPSYAEMREMFQSMGYAPEATFTQVLDLILMILPGCVVILIMLPCYAAQYLHTMSYDALGMKAYCTVAARRFIMSVLSAILFIISSIIMLFSASKITMFSAVSQNLWLILFPGMLVAGFWSLYASYKARPAPLYLILAVIIGCIMPHLLLLFVALSGATATLTRPLLLKIAAITAQQNKQNGSHGDDDHGNPPTPPSN